MRPHVHRRPSARLADAADTSTRATEIPFAPWGSQVAAVTAVHSRIAAMPPQESGAAYERVNVSTSRVAVPLMCERKPYIKVLTSIATLRRALFI
ncbi:hypothetical protein GCM10010524_45900 [Streptomyces mexicanus]